MQVVNLLPAPTMASVAHACLEARAHMVNASYIKDPLSRLDGAVREAGLLFLCEMGLDPGIDHMAACRTVRESPCQSTRRKIAVSLRKSGMVKCLPVWV